jgi:enamine deaminase RidA (YjgF/YER057c/UK114 family)
MARRALEPVDFPFFDYRRLTFSLGIAAGRCVWLSGATAVRFEPQHKAMVVAGDVVAQATVIFDKMRAVLAAGQRTLGDICRVVRYVTPAALSDMARLDALHEARIGRTAAVSTIVVKKLLRDQALIEMEAVAGSDGLVEYPSSIFAADSAAAWAGTRDMLRARGARDEQVLRTAAFATPDAALQQDCGIAATSALAIGSPCLVEAGARAQIDLALAGSGGTPLVFASAEGEEGDIVEQARSAYRSLGERLERAGTGLDAVVKTTEFITQEGLADYRKTADVRRALFAPPYPAATGVICDRLSSPRTLIAVEAVAMRGM